MRAINSIVKLAFSYLLLMSKFAYRSFIGFCYRVFAARLHIKSDRMVFYAGGYDGTHGNTYYLSEHAIAMGTHQVYIMSNMPRLDRGRSKAKLIYANSPRAAYVLATAKYLVTDSVFPGYLNKRTGQVLLNTWHGTPIKHMGYHVESAVQEAMELRKHFLAADILLFQNEYSKKTMCEAYELKDEVKAVVIGSPRNSVFFKGGENLRRRLGFSGKRVYVYMPTWRGAGSKETDKVFLDELITNMRELDKFFSEMQEMDGKTVLFYKFHSFTYKKQTLPSFTSLLPFPVGLETYKFLATVDCLITDYSSVLFDFALSRKEIILFPFDEERYIKDRGLYIGLEEMPFKKFYGTRELCEHIKSGGTFTVDGRYESFRQEYCGCDTPDAVSRVMEMLLRKK